MANGNKVFRKLQCFVSLMLRSLSCCKPTSTTGLPKAALTEDASRVVANKTKVECVKNYKCNKCNKAALKDDEKEECVCFCPLWRSCGFADESNKVYDHFRKHRTFDSLFTYGVPFFLKVGMGERRMLLQEANDGVIFILNNHWGQRVFSVDCIGPPTFNKAFTYKLSVECKGMRWSIKVYSEWEQHPPNPHKPYLFLTNLGCIGLFPIQICIYRSHPQP